MPIHSKAPIEAVSPEGLFASFGERIAWLFMATILRCFTLVPMPSEVNTPTNPADTSGEPIGVAMTWPTSVG